MGKAGADSGGAGGRRSRKRCRRRKRRWVVGCVQFLVSLCRVVRLLAGLRLQEWANALLVFVMGSSPISRTTEGHQLNAGVLLSSIARIQLCLQEESLGGKTINRKDQAMSGRRVRTYTVSATSVASTIARPMSPEPVMEKVM